MAQLWCTSNVYDILSSIKRQDYPSISVILGVPDKCHDAIAAVVRSASFKSLRLTMIPVCSQYL